MNTHYPVSLNIAEKNVVIIGGGKIAERKVRGALETGAHIEIISPELTEGLKQFVLEKRVRWKKKCFTPEDINQAFLVIAATNSKEVNQQVKKATRSDQLICLVDDPLHSDFILPSVLKRGRLQISISTNGASPMLAKTIRGQLEQSYDIRYQDYLDFLAEKREWILAVVKNPTKKEALLKAIIDLSFLEENREEQFHLLLKKMNL